MGKEFEYVFDVAGATTGEVRQGPVNDDERNKVVYLHKRADDGLPMYVGIGSIERAYSVSGRNIYWRRVFEKHGRTVELLYQDLTWDEACDLEIKLIKEYRSKYPEYIVNLTDGGEGTVGLTGEDNGYFKGHLLFISLCGKYYYICSGRKELEDAGFNNTTVYNTITGSNNHEYVTSKKLHINGEKIRFEPIRFNSVDDIDDEMLENRVEAVVCDVEIVGRAGVNHPMYKGYSLGVSHTQYVLLTGGKEMKSKKFHQGAISYCISGSRPTHKGFKWSRIDKDFDRSKLQTLKNLTPFDQDSKDRLEELLIE